MEKLLASTNSLDYRNYYDCRGYGIYPPSGKAFTEAARREVLNYLAAHTKSDNLIEGTGGIRKSRWSRWARKERRGACDFLLPQRADATLFDYAVCKECVGQLE